jgi:hypothetical protein
VGSVIVGPSSAVAQGLDVVPYVRVGTEHDRARRLLALLGELPRESFARANGHSLEALATGRDTVVVLHPEIVWSYNSGHPWGANDAGLRAGKGANLFAVTGVGIRVGRVTAMFAPQIMVEENREFQTVPYPLNGDGRTRWSNPFYQPDNPIDYPLRFGRENRSAADGEGRIALDLNRDWQIGVGKEQRWWGPGRSNALILSANSGPIDQAFVETRRPIATAIGSFEFHYFLGRLRESKFFDSDGRNNQRTLSAAVLSWQPRTEWALLPSVGIARAVMAAGPPKLDDIALFMSDVGRPWARPADTTANKEQILGVFARWQVPETGVEAYVEWARFEQPASLRDFLEQPGHSQGYTLGAQWATRWRGGLMHLGTEFSYLEPSPSIRTRPVGTSYVGTSVEQGWTHLGQMIGPWIGPGGSSQLATAELWYPTWRAGLSLGRLRRDPDPIYLNPALPRREDIQLYATAKYGRVWRNLEMTLEYTEGVRLNHLYQARLVPGGTGGETTGIDLMNRTLMFTLSPRLPRPAW